MQTEFKLSPLTKNTKTYYWEDGAWVGDSDFETNNKYAVLYREKILAIFDTLYWANEFVKNTNLTLEIMKVDE
jgi:hypothetical protein